MSNDPFEAAIALATQHKTQTLEQQNRVRADRQERQAREARERQVRIFARNFQAAIIKHGTEIKANGQMRWSPEAFEDARSYISALLCHSADTVLPTIDPGLAKIIQDKFTWGIVLQTNRKDNVLADDWFVGQRQDWFAELLPIKQKQAGKKPERNAQTTNQVDEEETVVVETQPVWSTSTPIPEQPQATTPKAKGKDRRPSKARTTKAAPAKKVLVDA